MASAKAKDARLKITHDKRADGASFVDPRGGRADFGTAVDAWIDRHAVTESTRNGYRATGRAWVKPAFEGRTVAQVNGLALKRPVMFDAAMSRRNAMLIVTYITKSRPAGP